MYIFMRLCDGVREGIIGILKADIYRPDVVHAQNSNINEYHGFEATINTNLTGDVQIEAMVLMLEVVEIQCWKIHLK